eukprot:m.550256 g.550256  ORF g.550256 m.550256 type:complete len:75 (-) comp22162_c1_seq11:1371-1595(-)
MCTFSTVPHPYISVRCVHVRMACTRPSCSNPTFTLLAPARSCGNVLRLCGLASVITVLLHHEVEKARKRESDVN